MVDPMTYAEKWLRKHNLTRAKAAKELDISKSSMDKYASGNQPLRRVVKYAMLYLELKWGKR